MNELLGTASSTGLHCSQQSLSLGTKLTLTYQSVLGLEVGHGLLCSSLQHAIERQTRQKHALAAGVCKQHAILCHQTKMCGDF